MDMIFVQPQPEPANFIPKVREPGKKFLLTSPHPKNWKNRDYWLYVLEDLYEVYNGICAYSVEWIPLTTGDPTVDHYIPKSVNPQLAYEWSNFRLACLRFNRWKREFQDVIDPFTIEPEWFYIQFPSLQVYPNPALTEHQKYRVKTTIQRLRLNSEICIKSRKRWIIHFRDQEIPFSYLKRYAPFIAYEIERQGLIDKITQIMKR